MRSLEFDKMVIACRPNLIRFANSLCRNQTMAEDLVQTTMLRAFKKHESFEVGTNMKAWLFTILRNEFLSQRRTAGCEVVDVDGVFSEMVPVNGNQADAYDLKIILGQMERLNRVQRMSLEMIGMDQMSYEEVAEALGLPAGTIKSQVSRARAYLLAVYEGRVEALRR